MLKHWQLVVGSLAAITALTACVFLQPVSAGEASAPAADEIGVLKVGSRILFQGDSITDGNRGRGTDPNHILGHGYQFIIAAKYGARFPERHLTFMNRGVSGNRVTDLAARWKADAIDLKPDVLSILIGINDLGGPLDKFEADYDRLLAETIKALPDVRLVLGEPFALPVAANKGKWPTVRPELEKRQAVVARLAAKYNAALVRYQRAFDDAAKRAPADYWIWDGIHPTYSGHQLMAEEWERAVKQMWPAAAR